MSNVLKRNRNLSDFEFYKNALLIRTEVIDIVNNEKYITKRRRITVGNRTLNHALDLVECITKANAAFPSTPAMLFIRKWYQQKALGECESLIESIRVIIEMNRNGKTNRLTSLVYKVASEIELIKRWMKKTKLLTHSKKFLAKENDTVETNNPITEETITKDSYVKSKEGHKEKISDYTVNEDNLTTSDKSIGNLLVQLLVLLDDTSRYESLV